MNLKSKDLKNIPFKFFDILQKYQKYIVVFVLLYIFLLLVLAPAVCGFLLLIIISVLLIGILCIQNIKKTFYLFFTILFVICLIATPACYIIYLQSPEFHLNEKIDPVYDHPQIIDMTIEFKEMYYDKSDDTETTLIKVSDYVEDKISYVKLEKFPSTIEALSKNESDCFGRALIGFTLLKNLGYDAYIVYSPTDNHAWLRIYEKNTYYEDYTPRMKYIQPLIRFNEDELKIVQPIDTINSLFTNGIYKEELEGYGFSSQDFFIPLFVLLLISVVIILLNEREKDIKKYVLFIIFALIVSYFAVEFNFKNNEFLQPIQWILVAGLYLRVIHTFYLGSNSKKFKWYNKKQY